MQFIEKMQGIDNKYALKIQIIDKNNTSQRQQSKPLRKNSNNREKMQVSDKKNVIHQIVFGDISFN